MKIYFVWAVSEGFGGCGSEGHFYQAKDKQDAIKQFKTELGDRWSPDYNLYTEILPKKFRKVLDNQ